MNQKVILSNSNFYNQLASEYNQMISFDKAVENKKKIFESILKPGMKYVADLGCGTGVDSIALASAGLKVAAFDPSDEMLKVAKENVEKKIVKVSFHNYRIDEIPDEFNDQFDLVVSLGNTFANIPKEKLYESLKRCFQILKPDGILFIQVLNYEKILNERERVVNITEGKDKYYVRFYDFTTTEIIFNILTFSKINLSDYMLITTLVFPHLQNDLIQEIKKAGFFSIELYSDFNQSAFDKQSSKDLVIRSQKV